MQKKCFFLDIVAHSAILETTRHPPFELNSRDPIQCECVYGGEWWGWTEWRMSHWGGGHILGWFLWYVFRISHLANANSEMKVAGCTTALISNAIISFFFALLLSLHIRVRRKFCWRFSSYVCWTVVVVDFFFSRFAIPLPSLIINIVVVIANVKRARCVIFSAVNSYMHAWAHLCGPAWYMDVCSSISESWRAGEREGESESADLSEERDRDTAI